MAASSTPMAAPISTAPVTARDSGEQAMDAPDASGSVARTSAAAARASTQPWSDSGTSRQP